MAREKNEAVSAAMAAQEFAESASPKPVAEGPSPWHIGLTANSPYDYLTVGGVTFHRQTEDVADKPNAAGETIRIPRQGQVVLLDADTVARVKQAAVRKVIRTASKRPVKYDIADPRYRRDASDVPVARFIYMVPVVSIGDAAPPAPIA